MDRMRNLLILLALATIMFSVSTSVVRATQLGVFERGIHVDHLSNVNSSTGVFEAELTNTNKFGTASASIISDVTATRFFITGEVSEHATELDKSFDPRAELFLTAEFSLATEHYFEFIAFGGGASESEHWQAYATLEGPDFLWHDQWSSVGPFSGHIERSGILYPGEYELHVRAYPIVFGGLDGGWAIAGVHVDLTILVPEPMMLTTLAEAIVPLWLLAFGRRQLSGVRSHFVTLVSPIGRS